MAYGGYPRGSNVDETLFGPKIHKKTARNDKEIAIVGKDTVQVRKRMDVCPKMSGKGNGAVVIAASELNRLRDSAKLLTRDEEMNMKMRAEEAYEESVRKSKERKERMMQMDEERKKNTVTKGTDGESRVRANGVLDKAKRMMDEDMDDVKHMNQMMLYGKVVTIRDAQINEKRAVQSDREEEERQLDMMMEIERLKSLKLYEEREKMRLQSQRKGAQVIVEQIKDRQTQRMRDEDARDLERAFVLKQIDALKQEEAEQQTAKHIAAQRLMDEVNVANSAAMKIKEDRMLAEKLEDEKIIEYNREQQRKEKGAEEEKARLAAEKEKETARLRAKQEKAQDKAAEMDALRAKRAVEASERVAREKDQKERRRKEDINQELAVARNHQQAEKERRLAEQAKCERDEFERIIEVQMQQEEAEMECRKEERTMRKAHVNELRSQISAREERSLQDRRDFLEEGNVCRAQIGAERRKLENIKTRKIAELQKQGVPEKYTAELAKKRISI